MILIVISHSFISSHIYKFLILGNPIKIKKTIGTIKKKSSIFWFSSKFKEKFFILIKKKNIKIKFTNKIKIKIISKSWKNIKNSIIGLLLFIIESLDQIEIVFFILFFLSILVIIFRVIIIELKFLNLKVLRKLEIECGIFNVINKNSNSLIYSLFLILFLIFDLEISLIIIQVFKFINIFLILIILLIILRLLIEIYEISLKWND